MTGLKQVNPSGGCWPNRLPNSSTSSSYLGPKRIKVAVRNSLRVDTRRSGSSATNMQKGPLLQSKSKTCQTCKTCETRQACKTSKTCDCSICSRPLQGLTRWKSRIPAAHQSMERKPGDSFPIRGFEGCILGSQGPGFRAWEFSLLFLWLCKRACHVWHARMHTLASLALWNRTPKASGC